MLSSRSRSALGRRRAPWRATLAAGLFILPALVLVAAIPGWAQEEPQPPSPAAELPEATEPSPPEAPPAPPAVEEAPAPAPAPEAPEPPRRRRSDAVVVGSSLTIDEDEVSRDVVVFGGSLTVSGRVVGDAAVLGGSVLVEGTGEITGDLAVIGGSITLEPGAEILGEVVTVGGSVIGAENAEIMGQIVEVPFGPILRFGLPWSEDWEWGETREEKQEARERRREEERERRLRRIEERHKIRMPGPLRGLFEVFWRIFGLLVLALLACLVYLLAPRPLARLERQVATDPWRSGLVGLVAEILFVPVLVLVVLILCISIIGIPLLILVPFAIIALVVVAFMGYVAVAHRVGRWCESRFGWGMGSPYVAIVVGVGVIQVWSFVGHLLGLGGWGLGFFSFMFLLVGTLLVYLAWTVGFGAALLTRFGTTEGGPSGAAEAALPPPPPAPAPAEPDWESDATEPPLPAEDAEAPEPPPAPQGEEPELSSEEDDWDKREI